VPGGSAGYFRGRAGVGEPLRERQVSLEAGRRNVRDRALAGEQRREVDRFVAAAGVAPFEPADEPQQGIVQVAVLRHAPEDGLDHRQGAPPAVEAEGQRVVSAKPFVAAGEVKVTALVAQVGVDVAEVLGAVDDHQAELAAGPDFANDVLDRQTHALVAHGGQEQAVAVVVDVSGANPHDDLVFGRPLAQDGGADGHLGDGSSPVTTFSLQDGVVVRPAGVRHEHVPARVEQQAGGELHELRRTAGQEQRQVRKDAGQLAQGLLEGGNPAPAGEARVPAAERVGPGFGAGTQELLEVQGGALLTGECDELPVGLLGAWRHAPEPGCIEVHHEGTS
jgi:hypothetical protein